jgi:hypothetical protein
MADRSGGRVVKAVAVTAAASTQRSLRRQLCPPHLQSRDVVFSGCTLRLTAFGIGRYRNVDLRGNDLSTVRGIPTSPGPASVRASNTTSSRP